MTAPEAGGPSRISALIVDDEPPARRGLRALLARHADVHVAGQARSGREAVEAIRTLHPDLVFLDVQMPEGDGFEVVRTIGVEQMPLVIFVTAYDTYALRAFEIHALDYLLKPYDRERFDSALDRARSQLRQRAAGADERLAALVERLDGRSRWLDRLTVPVGSRMRFVDVGDVDYFEAETNYVRAHVSTRSHLLRTTLTALEAKLDPSRFVRIHRSLVVQLARVAEVEPLFAGEYVIFLKDGRRLTSGRTYRVAVQTALRLRA
ncbi:MAG: response regulator transcription factor [Gemmatimonadaceae bacterium]|nr:response regulator transcription factor [Gemmatimonadaceae bacterium]